MTKNEVIEFINRKKSKYTTYLNGLSKEQKWALIDEWYRAFSDAPSQSVEDAFAQHEKVSRFFPYVSELEKYMNVFDGSANDNSFPNRWYSHFPQKGEIIYNDKDVEWATFEDWNNLPEELAKRMKFRPDTADPGRLELLKEIQELQLETFGESSVDEAIREAEVKQNVRNNHRCGA